MEYIINMMNVKIKNNKKKYIIWAILIIVFLLCCIPSQKYNSKNKLNIVTCYGDREPYHPKVISFKQKWNGYKYWMSYTPYPQEDDTKENPMIAVSNDLINWQSLICLDNPIVQPGKVYNSDAHIVYNSDLNRIECYWRYVNDNENKAIVYRRTSTDGMKWTEKEAMIIANDRQKKDYVSLAIIYEDNLYKMWYINKGNTLTYQTSKDAYNWDEPIKANISYEDGTRTWHIDVIHTHKGYEMVIVAYKDWKLNKDMNLYYSMSNDGINWSQGKTIIKPRTKTSYWDNKGIYRSSLMYEDGIYYVYYSGTNRKLNHGIGFMYGNDIFNLNGNNANFRNQKSVDKLLKRMENEKIKYKKRNGIIYEK